MKGWPIASTMPSTSACTSLIGSVGSNTTEPLDQVALATM